MKKKICPHEWLFTERCLIIYVIARNIHESGKKLIKLNKAHLKIPLDIDDMHWDYRHDVGYVDERSL